MAIALALSGVMSDAAVAAVTDLANSPLASGLTSATTVRPNIAYVVDDSGSMDDQNMPDDEGTNRDKRCWGWYKYNTLFYNPTYTYKPPFKLDGTVYSDNVTRFPDASFTAALKDGYFPSGGYTYGGDSTSNTTSDLSTLGNLTPYGVSCTATSECPSTPSKYYYSKHKTNASASTCEAATNYDIVTDAAKIEAPGIPNTGRTAAHIAAAKTNYANWYTYYRRRALLMKAASGEAFKDLDESKYRVGLFFINSVESGSNGSDEHNNNDLKIANFSGSASGTQRANWYAKLYGARTDGSTPLRGALSRMGRMYAGKIAEWDPVQYSCQQNFTIMSTDGFWNTGNESGSYGPKEIDGSTNVENTDGGATAAVAATSTITIGGQAGWGSSNGCYKFTSVAIDTGAATVELMNTSPAPADCSKSADPVGEAVRDAINANTATTGFSATYSSSNNRIKIVAPISFGSLATTPVLTVVKDSGSRSRSFDTIAFSGGAAATTGAPLPYKDALNASNTLADIAYYYYKKDLRDTSLNNCSNTVGGTVYTDLCDNNVRGSGKDLNSQQHMTTFTIGLGVSGNIKYESNYETAANIPGVTQYYDIVNDATNWPNPSSDAAKIDDLWHAAVNGRGTYYSATDANTLKQGVQSSLAGIQAQKGSSAAAATSNLEPVAGDNMVYVALYRTVKWDGDLQAFTIDPDTGTISGSSSWSAQAKLDEQVATAELANTPSDGRTIKFFSSGATNKMKEFTFTNLAADSLDSHFSNLCAKTPAIDQCGMDGDDLDTAQKALANAGNNLVDYLRGRTTYENAASNATIANRIFRGRDHRLGDTVNAVPVYMKKPPFSYDQYDSTYATFKTNNATRAPTVFIAANDGMLHAINATNDSADASYANRGQERWAYIPTQVMPSLWSLADRNYANNHRYFVDGSPTLADVCNTLSTSDVQICAAASNWKTILVAGLNKGGCSYYALDVTDPTTPKALWEFSNANLGYSYGNPIVAKQKNGRWVAIFSSGYNNYPSNGCGSTGDGNGHVFVVDAVTGALLEDIPTYTSGTTPAGTTGTPSGLAKLNAWIDDAALPVAKRLYGGDMRGNVWRVDFDNNYPPADDGTTGGKEAVLLAQLKDAATTPNSQPITTKPELAEITYSGARYPVIFVGTGKYLGENDKTDVSQQSIYALKDSLTSSGISNARGSSMISRTLAQTTGSTNGALAGRTIRTASGSTVNWTTNDGWYIDLNPGNTSPGERVNVDMSLQSNLLTVAANVPSENACNVGGYSFLYFLDINSGKNLSTATDGMAGVRLSGNALIAGIKTVKLTSGKTKTICTDTAGNFCSEDTPDPPPAPGASTRRTTWREITN